MDHAFDKDYWEDHWRQGHSTGHGSTAALPPNPYLQAETDGLVPGRALDAGCGAGAEAIWLASQGWRVTGADLSSAALGLAASRAQEQGVSELVQWVEADLSTWTPTVPFDLVMSHYAHPAMPQLDFYDRIASWVAPGGTLLVVGHLHTHDGADAEHDERPPVEASVTAASVTARLHESEWDVATAEERQRLVVAPGGRESRLHDVVVRARKRS